jgi:hypothetical protein
MSVNRQTPAGDTLWIAQFCFQIWIFEATTSTPDTLLEFQMLP